MSVVAAPDVWLIRHGETEWTVSRRHTGLTNLPLTDAGEKQARALRSRLQTVSFVRVFNSPLQRAARTCELARYGLVSQVDPEIDALRRRQIKNFIVLNILAVGTPMLLMGDEVRRSQNGNQQCILPRQRDQLARLGVAEAARRHSPFRSNDDCVSWPP